MFVFDPRGRLLRTVNVEGSSTLLLDLAFHPRTNDLLVIDFGHQQVLAVNPVNGKSNVFTTIPGGAAAGPNVLTFDAAGNVYVSDSFQGAIWRSGVLTCERPRSMLPFQIKKRPQFISTTLK